MLDSETKKRIDDIRDILAGKTPGPESQVEQITTALIYKFMHDMDEESVGMGGKRSFFVGEYKKYAWKNLFDPKLEGADRVSLYREAIEKMEFNPGAPELFREIFKGAELPFRDARTLGMFLKVINEFDYSHSEKLGDAFEYLLSFMGSQGDAGQFRTPRHIIDFIVEIINPQKNEKILDPACGTGGFLISSFKHIQKQNTNKKSNGRLTAADRKRIGKNLVGYDISPDMTRLSLVNMYLHDFATPKIYEYDTLSSEDRWNEYYDVILANPPFFSPKGGIQPHSRFGVQSKRAEVLFVDYIMEHLNPKGRAGIIVPEGIIFQTGRAYKTLRKKLVEDCLIGVISLPAGVFNPYSGVRTSILILDKELCKKTDSVFFAKVENDGFSLGAQRRSIDKNDIPEVVKSFKNLSVDKPTEKEKFVERKKILKTEDFSLSQGKYLSSLSPINSDFPLNPLGSISEITMGQSPASQHYNSEGKGLEFHQGKTKFTNLYIEHSGVWASQYNKVATEDSILMSVRAPVGPVNITKRKIALGRGLCGITSNDECNQMFLFYMLQSSKEKLTQSSSGSTFDSINRNQLLEFEIPLPLIEIQQEIVKELDGYQKIIDGCRQVVENYKPTIDIDPSWEMVELRDLCKIYQPQTITQNQLIKDGQYLVFGANGVIGRYDKYNHEFPEVIVTCRGATCGTVNFSSSFSWITGNAMVCSPKDETKLIKDFLFYYLSNSDLSETITGSAQPQITRASIEKYLVSVPPIGVQQEIVGKLEKERKMIDSNKQLIEIHTQKIQDRISKVWGE